MSRLSQPKLIYLKAGDTFHYENRELPIFEQEDENICGKGEYYCISHKKFLDDTGNPEKSYDNHTEHPSNHKLVWYCFRHQVFEEV